MRGLIWPLLLLVVIFVRPWTLLSIGCLLATAYFGKYGQIGPAILFVFLAIIFSMIPGRKTRDN